jgi:phosphoglucomutase
MAALGLVEIGSRGEDRHALSDQLIEDAPEVAARNRIDAVVGSSSRITLGDE